MPYRNRSTELFSAQGQQITLTDALLWLLKDNGLLEEDVEVLRFLDKHCSLTNLNDKPEPLANLGVNIDLKFDDCPTCFGDLFV